MSIYNFNYPNKNLVYDYDKSIKFIKIVYHINKSTTLFNIANTHCCLLNWLFEKKKTLLILVYFVSLEILIFSLNTKNKLYLY